MNPAGKKLLIILVGTMMMATALCACIGENKPAVNKPPVARISAPATGSTYDTGISITFDGSQSKDPEKKPLSFRWDFGDNQTGAGNTTMHAYTLPGRYVVTLTASDGKKNGTDRLELRINQANRAPAARFNASTQNASNEEDVEFNANATTDADDDTLAFSWSFGDATTAEGRVVKHRFPVVGQYNVTLNVSDGKSYAAASLGIRVYQANRPPVPSLSATPLVAFLNSDIEFNASASTDADNDTLTSGWSFGDGANGTGLVVKHAFSKVGNFTVTASVSDGKVARTANIIVTVIPRAQIFIDWNQTDFGYILKYETDVDKANVSASVVDEAGATDNSPGVLELSKTQYRIRPTVVPVRSHALTITAKYLGMVSGTRTLHIYDSQAMPGTNSTAAIAANITTRKYNATYDEQTTMGGSGTYIIRGSSAMYAINVTGKGNSTNIEGDKKTVANSTLSGNFSMTYDWGTQTLKTQGFTSAGNMSQVNITSGMELLKLYSEMVMSAVDHNTTYASIHQNGTMPPFSVTINSTFLGIEDHANGAGKVYSCMKVHVNGTMRGDLSMLGIGNVVIFQDETQWSVRDDRYDNTTIYRVYKIDAYNETGGNWSYLSPFSKNGTEYPDDNKDGIYNPDLKPTSMDDAFEFRGPIPRELVVGDRIAGTNIHGVKVVMEVLDESTLAVDGKSYTVVHTKSTFSSASGNATGTTENWIISKGNLTGAALKSLESKTWINGGLTEANTSEMLATSIRED